MSGGVSTPGVGNSGRLRTCDARVFLAVRDNLGCARPFTNGVSGPCAVIVAAGGTGGTCTCSGLRSPAGVRATIGGVTAGEGADESAAAGLSADTGLSGCGNIDTARTARAKPAGTAIQPAHPAAGIMRRRNCWLRDFGRGSVGGGGASPCHSHNPDSLRSVLTNWAEEDIGGVPVTIGALLYASFISSRASACMLHIPLLVAAPIPAWQPPNHRRWPYHSVRRPRTDSGRIGLPHQTVFWQGTLAIGTVIVLK
jgi:hypothetical protein